ncbi:hypothetical protein AJ79_10267 [Helicocarpus griseus UAMH5409]|uniref:Uncharacterized protein n=1 Tax=Helicocarpus griseus UAMH5409 TaxID=1447875 RepID=A0A2B7W6F9_9EURO|nr:hypothetical protein AJ79_10267 [Helicocarpus griseus UAMH5409]
MQIDYAIMGGAATCLMVSDPARLTEDVDMVIHVDHRMIAAERLTTELLTKYPFKFAPVDQFGHTIPGYRLALPGGASRMPVDGTVNINGRPVKMFGPEWIPREKILAQHERQGGLKEATDIRDVANLIPFAVAGKPELNFSNDQS